MSTRFYSSQPITDELLVEVVRRIRSVGDPLKIVLFGSHARGDARPDSDLDVLVIIPGIQFPRQESVRLRRALRGLLIPIDVLVATPQQIERHADTAGLIYGPALREGKVLYERATAL